MTTYTQALDVALELGRPASSTDETAQWEAWIARVERALRRGFRAASLDLDQRILDGLLDAADVVDVVVARVVDKINNPTGVTSVTRSIDDASITTRREGVSSNDPLAVTDAEWASLLPQVSHARAFSIMPS